MFFFPVGCLLFFSFILLLPILFLLGVFHVITISFAELGISPELTFILLLSILAGSSINIPLTKTKKFYKKSSFSFFERPKLKQKGVAVNLGGAIIPLGLSIYFFTQVPLWPTVIAVIFMIIISKFSARVIPNRGVALPFFIPPIFSALFAIMLVPEFAAQAAFIAGVLGVLIGADLLNLKKAMESGMVFIGGAGVFDGIFLVGIVAVLLTSL